MAAKTVLRMGDPRLRQVAELVRDFDTAELHQLVADMTDTMRTYNGAGLAATQIGVPLRVAIFGLDANPRYPDAEAVPFTVLVNPQIEPLGGEIEEGWEGCLSVPGMRGLVPRHLRVRYTGYDPFGQPIDRTVAAFHARVVQHECDHLDGILYPDRMRDLRSLGYLEELQAIGAVDAAAAAD